MRAIACGRGDFTVSLPGRAAGLSPQGPQRPRWMTNMTDDDAPAHEALARIVSPPIASEVPAIDLAHLARMTLGERSLETQVLQLFDRQAELLFERMRE